MGADNITPPPSGKAAKPDPLSDNRRRMEADALARPRPAGVRFEACTVAGVPCEWARPEQPLLAQDTCILYAHGGAFCVGSVITHRNLVGALAKACGLPALSVDYRLAPENGFPAAAEDMAVVYQALVAEGWHVIAMGDSAGGSLAAGLPLQAREHGWPKPEAVVLLSPWLDLACTAASFNTNASRDPFMKHDGALFVIKGYLKKNDPRQPLASPLYGDLAGFPPVLLQASADEVLLDDSTRFADKVNASGGHAQLSVWAHVHHVWHFLYDSLPAAREAVEEVGRFVRNLTPLTVAK